MKKINLSGKGFFIFSDPGGAKPCLSFILQNNINNYLVISDRKYNFYSEFNIDVIITDKIEEYIAVFKPDYIFTATSYTSNIEKIAIKNALENNILCFTYLDHTTNLINRFRLNNELYIPSIILFSDTEIQNKLRETNVFASCNLINIKNPYLFYLENWVPKIERNDFLSELKIPTRKKIFLIAFDPLSNINGREKYGYDEISGINEIKSIIKLKNLEYTFVLKPHPNQNLELLKSSLSRNIILISSDADTNYLIYYSDIIMGYFSNILLEANIFNKKIIRYRPQGFKNDPFQNKNFGVVATKDTLIKFL